ncbi:MAG: hypothetical protein IJ272_10695, partial [Clostridia bacterium]|nr:hypothetical protein [Clostridia bacterium]
YQEAIDNYDKKLTELSLNSKYKCLKFEDDIQVNPGQFSDNYMFYYIEDNIVHIECLAILKMSIGMGVSGNFGAKWTYSQTYNLNNSDDQEKLEGIGKYVSTASKLQGTIASWYNALRRIALVGLLSVLVYVGIRIVLSSSSQDKAKYKEMLKDWLVALCLLFTLHYIMNATIVIVNEISDIFSTGETDPLLNSLRTDISDGSWGTVLAQTIMYATIVIFTITFTVQYMMRVIHMAFYTMIAPLITLTYPLDKIKDGQAQAFNMWIREYMFTALVQVIHLVIYFVLVSSALELVEFYPIFAIVAMMFIKKAEGIIKKMFGFEKSETVGTIGAAATGALVVNAMNQLKGLGGKKGKASGGDSGSGGGSTSSNVRTATTNPLGAMQGGAGGGSGSGAPSGGGTPSSSTTRASTSTGTSSAVGTRKANTNSSAAGGNNTAKRRIKGAANLGNKYILKNLDKVGGAALGLLTGGAGAMIGFAAGVAQGDIGKAFGGAVAGGTAGGALGNRLGKGVAKLPENIGKGVTTGWNNVKNTYREGAYGEEVAKAIKFDEEFRNGSTYKALQSNSNFSEESVQAMLDSGITDKKEMTAILDSGLDVNEAIKYNTLAKNCPNEIYYNDNMLRTFWRRTMGVEEKNAERIRDVLGQFK